MIAEGRRGALLALLLVAGCTSDALRREYLERQSSFLPPPTRPVIVIPGFGSSRLFDPATGRFVWGTAHSMVQRGYPDDVDLPIDPETGEIGSDRLVPRGFLGSRGFLNTAWQIQRALAKYGGYNKQSGIHLFEYDWRHSATDHARDLDRRVETIRRERGDPRLQVDLVTHSAGALIALAFIHQSPEKVHRAVLVAPPLGGTLEAFRVLTRGERLIRRTIDPRTAATFPFLFELLPSEPFLIDERGASIPVDWSRVRPAELAAARAFDRLLARGREVRAAIDRPLPSGVDVIVLAGDCVPTAHRALRRSDGSLAFYPRELREEEGALGASMFEPGDGSIPWSSALRLPVASQLFCDGHHGIASDPNVHRALLRALSR